MCKVVKYKHRSKTCVYLCQNLVERMVKNVTPKQRKFCLEYVQSGNATESAIKAGYSEKTARFIGAENLTKPNIKEYIQKLTEELESQKIATAREMQEMLTSIIRSEAEEEVIVVEGLGDGVSEAVKKTKRPATKDRIKAIETLAKMQGVLDNKTALNICIPVFGGEDNLED